MISLSACSATDEKTNIKEIETSNQNTEIQTPTNNETPVEDSISYYGSDNDVYRINITTNNNEFPNSSSTYLEGSLNITEQDTSKVLINDEKMKIRLRGNSTIAADKKPFKIKFDKKQSLFGLEAAKDWVLLANYYDKTNLRNYLAYSLANKLDTSGFQPSAIFVDVYLNNDYQGLYLLTEQIEVNQGRVDIEDNISYTGISSFLLEVDERAIHEFAGYDGKCYIKLGGYTITFKYPKASDYVDAINNNDDNYINSYEKNLYWVTNYLNEAYDSLKSLEYTSYNKYFDISSFIDYYLVQEFFKNVDIGFSSQYYVIDQNDLKIKCGPVWDFDISAGVIDDSQGSYIVYAEKELFVREWDQFYKILFKDNKFVAQVMNRYKEIRPILFEIIDEIEVMKLSLSSAQSRNIKKWSFPKNRVHWIEVYGMSVEYFKLPSLAHHYQYLTDTLEERIKILDKYYLY